MENKGNWENEQLQRVSPFINAINIWNTIYLEKTLEYLKTIEEVNEDTTPLVWEHITF